MAGTAVNNSAALAWYHSAAIAGGGLTSGGTALGSLVEDGTELNNPEILTEPFFVGEASTGASISGVLRILGTTIPAAMVTAAAANPPTEVYLFVANVSQTKYTQYKCRLTEPFQEPTSTSPKRTAWMVGFTAKGDAVSDFLTVIEATVT